MRRYDALFLDAQGTLLQAHPSVAALYGEACRRCGKRAGPREMTRTIADLWTDHRRTTRGRQRYDTSDEITRQWWTDFNTRLFHRLGMEGEPGPFVAILWDIFGRPENWRTFPEVEEVVEELRRRGYRLGVVSNWDPRLLPICDGLGLTAKMDFLLASSLAGVEKPDPRIFHLALSRAGVSPDRAIHVGDDYEADLQGARGAGIDALLLDREGNHAGEPNRIHTLRELLEILP